MHVQGVNLESYITTGQLIVIDLLTDSDLIAASNDTCVAPAAAGGQQQALFAASARIISSTAAAEIRAAQSVTLQQSGLPCQHSQPSVPAAAQPQVVVMFDAISQLCGLASSSDAWLAFLTKLTGRCKRQSDGDGPGVSICAVLHDDECDAATEDHLTSAASLIVNVLPLAAGQSVDVTGRMEVLLKDCRTDFAWAVGPSALSSTFYFKSTDSSVRFLPFYNAA